MTVYLPGDIPVVEPANNLPTLHAMQHAANQRSTPFIYIKMLLEI